MPQRLTACLLAGLLAWSVTAPAEARRDAGPVRQEAARHGPLSLEEAVAHVRRDTGGRVLSTQTRAQRRGTTYRIKVLLPDFSVRYVDVEAQPPR